ncbi:receptor-like protein 12 [Durio zibethinus]|uniref:Receptor-like protein 12 n=1 Tax=Durio zibethinus TaxID=66656 RepID=A0A6P5Y2H3_DURZI|nr:receptor-like protein 12 [Durio zibethinus]
MGHLPEFPINNKLQVLSLSWTKFREKLPKSIGNLRFLTKLDLVNCSFFGPIPSSVANLTNLVELDLSDNGFNGLIPPFHRSGVPNLAILKLGGNWLSGSVHSSLFTLPSLHTLSLEENLLVGKIDEFPNASSSVMGYLRLDDNDLIGSIPNSILQLPRLEVLYIGDNNFGSMNLDMFFQLKNLRSLDLSNMSLLIGSYNKSPIFPHLEKLALRSCNLTGFPEFIKTQGKLAVLDLSHNQLANSSFSIESNNKSFTIPQLDYLNLESCNLTEFPEFIKTQNKLTTLYLSNNKIHGFVPNWLWKTTLLSLDLSFNAINFSKEFPFGDANSSFSIESNNKSFAIPQLGYLNLRSCNLTEFPEFIKTQDKLTTLYLSNNQIHGLVPNWLWKTTLLDLYLSFNAIEFPKQFPFGDANSSFPMLRGLY